MKVKEFVLSLGKKYDNKLKIIKKGIFWILINEDAFFLSKSYNLKITVLDRETIKVGFPDGSKEKWLNIFKEKKLAYALFEKEGNIYIETEFFQGKEYISIFDFNIEDYTLTKERILGLKKLGLEEKNESNFLLKEKVEEIYILSTELLLRLPKKERYFLREKIERIFLDLLENIYSYMYKLGDRHVELEYIFKDCILLREYFRLLYKIGKIKNENVYLDIGDKWIEVLKICKGIKSKYTI